MCDGFVKGGGARAHPMVPEPCGPVKCEDWGRGSTFVKIRSLKGCFEHRGDDVLFECSKMCSNVQRREWGIQFLFLRL